MFPQLDGMFALAIYDTQQKTMRAGARPAGEKPLYYRSEPGLFLFGSELQHPHQGSRAGLEHVRRRDRALHALSLRAARRNRILEGVRKLKPGCMLTIDAKGKILSSAATTPLEVDPDAEASQEGFLQTCDRVEAAMIESLRRRLISDVPLGMFLSSGIDSSLVVRPGRQAAGHRAPRTFTIGFEGDDGSEHNVARSVAQHLGTQHSEHVFGASDFDNAVRSIGTLLDEPNGDRSCASDLSPVQVRARAGDGGAVRRRRR